MDRIVVTVLLDPIHGPTVAAFGPWTAEKCDRERRRLLADHAFRNPGARSGTYTAHVVLVDDWVVAP